MKASVRTILLFIVASLIAVVSAAKVSEEFLNNMNDEIKKNGVQETSTDLFFTHVFPNNPLKLVRSGEQTELLIGVKNVGASTQTLFSVSGSLTSPKNFSIPLRNVTAQRYSLPLEPKQEATVPFRFAAEMEPQDIGLVVFVDYFDNDEMPHRVIAYQDVITVSAADSTFDLAGISLLAILGGSGYFLFQYLYKAYFPERVVKKVRPSAAAIREEIEARKDVLSEEWIPEHVKKAEENARKSAKKTTAKK
ncbi:SWI/SNF and RSC complex subunit Ssr1 [Blyttiomyces sp. JEL0837]|nr:SWI/SNF and RSC complex subunit Ssr1 [Blyttiomyces sp. JEL0837]